MDVFSILSSKSWWQEQELRQDSAEKLIYQKYTIENESGKPISSEKHYQTEDITQDCFNHPSSSGNNKTL